MITGDYPATAEVIAAQAGLRKGDTLTGDELEALSDTALFERMPQVTVCARIAPAQSCASSRRSNAPAKWSR